MKNTLIPPQEEARIQLYQRIQDRALGQNKYGYEPYSCYIEYKTSDPLTGLEYRDCTIDYTKCPNSKCIKKLT